MVQPPRFLLGLVLNHHHHHDEPHPHRASKMSRAFGRHGLAAFRFFPNPASRCSVSVSLLDKPPGCSHLHFGFEVLPRLLQLFFGILWFKKNNLPKGALGVWNQQYTLLPLGEPCA